MIVDLATVPRDTAANGGTLMYLSRAGGVTQFGAYVDRLMPGAVSSQRHWHSAEDEFALVLSGHATLLDDDGAHELAPGDACCWRHGEPNGHHIRNDGDAPFVYLIVGSRALGDICTYPDEGEWQVNTATDWWVEDRAGRRIKGGRLPPHLLNLASAWGTPCDPALPARRVLPKGSVTPHHALGGAEHGLPDLGPYTTWPMSDEGGLTQFGALTEMLMPGSSSSHRHWHAAEDEFLYVLEGIVTLIENDGAHDLAPGACVCWPAGVPNGHCLQNRTAGPVLYFVVGTRLPEDEVTYPDIDLHYRRAAGWRHRSRKDGTPLPGWPKETNR